MSNSRTSLWAAGAATAMTLATMSFIGTLAQVDADASGLPVVRLERVEVVGSAGAVPGGALATHDARIRRAL
jgi:hypothetical protein